MPSLLPAYLDTPRVGFPVANFINIAGAGGAWVNGSWVEIVSALPADFILTSVLQIPTAEFDFEIDIGTGLVSAEVVIATVAGTNGSTFVGMGTSGSAIPLKIPPPTIPAGTRLIARMRVSSSSVSPTELSVEGYLLTAPLRGTLTQTSNLTKVHPALSAGTAITPNGTAWVNSAWFESHSGIPNDWILLGFVVVSVVGSIQFEIDVGTGTAGNEVVAATRSSRQQSSEGTPRTLMFDTPVRLASGARVAMRLRKTGTSVVPWGVKLIYVDGAVSGGPITTSAGFNVPTAANFIGVATSASAWTFGSWTEITASLAATGRLAGLAVEILVANVDFEVAIGIGTAGVEETIGTFRVFMGQVTNPGPVTYTLPLAGRQLPAGTRVVARAARQTAGATTLGCALLFTEAAGTDYVTQATFTCVPKLATGISITPSGTAWVNSAWVELTTGLATRIGHWGLLVNISHVAAVINFEVDVGIGTAGNEVVVDTYRGCSGTELYMGFVKRELPQLIAANTRIALRFRKDTTNTNAWTFTLQYYEDVEVTTPRVALHLPVGAVRFPGRYAAY